MKRILFFLMLGTLLIGSSSVFAQKPTWVDNPGSYSAENFVSVGVAKDSRPDKAKEKAEKKSKAALEKLLRNKYPKKDVKGAMTSLRFEAYYQDPATKYYYVLALIPIETLDKDYAKQKMMDRNRSAAMGAVAMLNAQTKKDPDVIIVRVDEEVGEEPATEAVTPEESEKPVVSPKTSTPVSTTPSTKATSVNSTVNSAPNGGSGVTDFKSKSLGSYKWTDQDQNSKYSFLGDGHMTVSIASGEYWNPQEPNKSAPRLELPNVKGDFEAIVKVKMDWSRYYSAGFGLTAHNGNQNVRAFVFYNGAYVYVEGYAGGIEVPRTEKSIEAFKDFGYLKLVRKGYTWTAYYSTIADDWVEYATFETEFPETANVGLVLLNAEGSTVQAKVEFVQINQ